jgi:plastocyanin
MLRLFFGVALTSLLTLGAAPAGAQEMSITIKDHKFQPAELKVPAKKRITLTVINADATPEEFESKVLKVEKVIPAKSKAIVRFGPLKPGRYEFVGEFHEDTAKGVVIAE